MTEPAIMPSPGNIEAVLVRFEGKLDRMIDSQNRHAEDMKLVRERLHDHANILTSLTTLNIQEKLAAIAADLKEHEHRIGLCEVDMQQRQGAAMVVKALWALVCLVGAGGIAAIVKLIVSH